MIFPKVNEKFAVLVAFFSSLTSLQSFIVLIKKLFNHPSQNELNNIKSSLHYPHAIRLVMFGS
jgi:hypothetical protein